MASARWFRNLFRRTPKASAQRPSPKRVGKNPSAFLGFHGVATVSTTPANEGFQVRKSIRQKLANSKRRIQRRLDKTNLRGCSKPILTASNLHYEIAERTRRAIVQEGEWIINQRKRGPTSTARPGAGRRRCVVVNQEIVALRTRDLRLFKG